MSSWLIEPVATTADLDRVIAIEQESFTNPWTREMYVSELENHGVSFLFVARNRESLPIGFCAFWRIRDELHINNLAVLPAYRRQGVATALLSHVLREGAGQGVLRATLEVRTSNDAARQLYEQFGFSVAGVRRGYYSDPPEDALILWKNCPDAETG
jgi:ribosomal-protein-alanine N-acetyltransferase